MPQPDKDTRSTDEQLLAHLVSIDRTLKRLPLKVAIYSAVVIVVVELAMIALTSDFTYRMDMNQSRKPINGIRSR